MLMAHPTVLRNLVARYESLTAHAVDTDGKGASYGTHENYLTPRSTPFGSIVTGLTPFLVSRQVFAGAGRSALRYGYLF